LLESEFFGHQKGASTGAIAQRTGRFELANQGTLFFDEVGDIPLCLPKLFAGLQEQEFERLGSARTLRVDVRVVVATHHNLEQMVNHGEFVAISTAASTYSPGCFRLFERAMGLCQPL
jgi:formate hydrogenlyase transcriptional activator